MLHATYKYFEKKEEEMNRLLYAYTFHNKNTSNPNQLHLAIG